jgi:hypothetical protein
MLVTFREHAAPDLCIFHLGVTMEEEGAGAGEFGFGFAISGVFALGYRLGTGVWDLKC